MKWMRSFAYGAIAVGSVLGQKLETQNLDPKNVVRVETAKDHLTVIELADPVTMVAVGNQSAFSVERRENKVFVKPVEDQAKTNLFIWTATGRYAYELAPAPGVEQMHFAIDQTPPTPKTARIDPLPRAPVAPVVTKKDDPLPAEMLTEATPILIYGERDTQRRVEITLRDSFEKGGRLYLRYAVQNRTGRPYLLSVPVVTQLSGIRARQSLVPLRDRQLGERFSRSLKVKTSNPVTVVAGDELVELSQGANALGWLVVERPKSDDETAVLRFEFRADERGPVEALLVLARTDNPEKVAHAGYREVDHR